MNDDSRIAPVVADPDCKMADRKRSDGKLTWTVHCAGSTRGSRTGEITMMDDSYEAAMRMQDARLGPVETTQRVKGRRIGDCRN